MDMHQLENQIHHDKKLQIKNNWLALFDHYAAIYPGLDPKEKYRLNFKINSFIVNAFKASHETKEELEYYISLLKKFPGKPHDYSKIVAHYQVLTGGEPKTVTTKLSDIAVEGGTITVSDIGYRDNSNINSDPIDTIIEDVAQGRAFHWNTGGDGGFGVILRQVDSPEPSANAAEYRHIRSSGPVVVIAVPSGWVAITEMGFEIDTTPFKIKVVPGNYKVAVYSKEIPDKFYGYLVVLCPTSLPAVNELHEIVKVE